MLSESFGPLLISFAAAFIISAIIAPGIIARLRRQKIGQTISEDGPKSHLSKAGTPTMGGVIIVIGLIVGCIVGCLFAGKNDVYYQLIAVMILVLSYSVLGMIDDYLTIWPVNGVRGIASKPKAALQFIIAILFVCYIVFSKDISFEPVLRIGGKSILSGYLYWVFAVVFIVGMSNFINITDGLDGLVSGLTIVASLAFLAAWGITDFSHFSMLRFLLCAIGGASLAFLWFNTNPAKVFMGDTGSLALGAALPAVAILTHREVLMIIIGAVFLMDGLSTAIQWAVFKFTRITTGTGRRVFKKSPVHHHFELCGWPEQTVTIRFWIIGAVAAVVGLAGAIYGLW